MKRSRVQIKNPSVLCRLTAWLLGTSLVIVSCRGVGGGGNNRKSPGGGGNARIAPGHAQPQTQQEQEQKQSQSQSQRHYHAIEHPSSKSPYRIVIDGGSTGSRLHVFEFHKNASDADNVVTCTRRGSSRANVPLSAFAATEDEHDGNEHDHYGGHANATHVAQHLLPLFEDAAQIIPVQYHASTTVHYQATAGMRLLEDHVQEAIYDALYEGLMMEETFVFRNMKRNDISTLGGEKEALYGAIAANYLKGVVDVNLHMIEKVKEEDSESDGMEENGSGDDQQLGLGEQLNEEDDVLVVEDYYDGPLGALDMGGASMQIVYLPHINDDDVTSNVDEDLTAKSQRDGGIVEEEPLPMPSLPNRLNGDEFFSTSYLSYGADQFRERLWGTWVRERKLKSKHSNHFEDEDEDDNEDSSKIIDNPCLFRGYTLDWEGYTFLGSGDAEKCSEEISRLIPHHEDDSTEMDAMSSANTNTNVSMVAKHDNSTLSPPTPLMASIYPNNRQVGGVEHPPIRGHFFAMSLFFFTLDCLRELSGHKSLNDTWPTPSIADLTSALHDLCSRSWDDDLKLIQDNAHEFTRPQVLPDRCFESVYMVTLLRDGFGFEPESRDITFTFLVDGSEVEWSLGLAISHFAEEHSPAVTVIRNSGDKEEESSTCNAVPAAGGDGGMDVCVNGQLQAHEADDSQELLSNGPILQRLNLWLSNVMTAYYK